MPPRTGERGALRGCCIGLAVMIVLAAASLVLLLRLTGTPDLGLAPAGARDGASGPAIAATLATQVGDGLSSSPQTTVTVSERDLTVLAGEDNPDPGMFTDPQVRSRGGRLVLSAGSHLGPMAVVTIVKLSLSLTASGDITLAVVELDVGEQVVPGFIRADIDPRGNAPFDLSSLLGEAGMTAFRSLVDCVAVVPGGVELGFHRQGVPADAGYCTRAAAST